MNFKFVNDQELLTRLKSTVQNEKSFTHTVLLYLREVENRRLYLEKGYSSLYVFCMEFLHYSEPEAQLRIQAMRLLKSVPIVEEKIKSGEISLTVAANVQSHFNKENIRRKDEGLEVLSFDEKLEVVQKVQNLSVRKSEQTLAAEFPEASLPKDKIKPLTAVKTKFEFMANSSLGPKLEELQNMLAHKNPYNNLGELVEILADMTLEQIKTKGRSGIKRTDIAVGDTSISQAFNTMPHGAHYVSTKNELVEKRSLGSGRKYISIKTKRMVHQKSNDQCCYVDKDTNTKCASRYALQIDHIIPIALGGSDDLSNLRLLCRPHNQYMALKMFG